MDSKSEISHSAKRPPVHLNTHFAMSLLFSNVQMNPAACFNIKLEYHNNSDKRRVSVELWFGARGQKSSTSGDDGAQCGLAVDLRSAAAHRPSFLPSVII